MWVRKPKPRSVLPGLRLAPRATGTRCHGAEASTHVPPRDPRHDLPGVPVFEGVAADLSTRLFDIRAYLRLSVDRGMDKIEIGDWDQLATIESHTWAYMESTAVTRSIENSLKNIREMIGSVTLGQISERYQLLSTFSN